MGFLVYRRDIKVKVLWVTRIFDGSSSRKGKENV
nr:MAG TPA: hypothetical protein [Caudoviricetes sp.]